MSVIETRRSRWLASLLFGLLATSAWANNPSSDAGEPLGPEPRHENIGVLVTQFIQKSHYLHISVDDDLSSRVLDRYIDALDRNESCGGHFRLDHAQDGEAKRDDENYKFVSAWEYTGENQEPNLHKEDLVFENVELKTRSYK